MSLNALEIGLISKILNRDLSGAMVQEVFSPSTENRIVVRFRSPGETHHLLIALETGMNLIGRIGTKPPSTPTPHPFAMLLRKTLVGLVLDEVAALQGDRVVTLDFSKGDQKGRLVCELTSRHANIFSLGTDGLINGSFYPNRSNLRALHPGEPYQQPFPHPVEGELANRFESAEDLEAAVAAYYKKLEETQRESADTLELRRILAVAKRRLKRLEKNLKGDLARAEEARRMENLGHVLKANLHAVKRGQTELKTRDFTGEAVVIPLDPKVGPVANMQQLFKKAKRFDKATEMIAQRLAGVQGDLAHLMALGDALESAGDHQRREMRDDLIHRHPFLKKRASGRKGEQPTRLPFREFAIAAGRPAMVGRSARDNDTLTLRHAKPFDLWLHVRGGTGSHVVVPMGRKEETTPELLIDAAHLAAHFSTFKNDTDVEILYTRRRYVQKPRGAPPGSVRLLKEKTIHLRVEPARLKKILTNNG